MKAKRQSKSDIVLIRDSSRDGVVMAKPGFSKHPKFLRLCYLLAQFNVIPQLARGHVEYIWDSTHYNADPIIGDVVAVEITAGWTGKPGELCKALMDCGGPGRAGLIEYADDTKTIYQVHDFWDHVPEYVRSRQRSKQYRDRKKEKSNPSRDESRQRPKPNAPILNLNPLPIPDEENTPETDPDTGYELGGIRPPVRNRREPLPTISTGSPAQFAVTALDNWSNCPPPVGRGHKLVAEQNETRKIFQLVGELAGLPPIIRGNDQIARELLIPQVVNAMILNQREFKHVGYAIGCIKNALMEWSRDGRDPTEKKQSGPTWKEQDDQEAVSNAAAAMEALRNQED